MPVVNQKLPEFPGFAVQYDPSAKPFFVSMVLEDMRKIASKDLGKTLLKSIADATPRARQAAASANEAARAIIFNEGVNVVIVPTSMTYIQTGYKMGFTPGSGMQKSMLPSTHAAHNVPGCPYYPSGGSVAEAADISAAGDGTGTVSIMKYTNAQIVTAKGEATLPYIVLAHELIHSLHHVTGTRRDHGEEDWTTGIGLFSDNPMSENAFRKAFGIKPREKY